MTKINDMYRGSNTEKDKYYHQNWFNPNETYQRQDSQLRLKSIVDNYDITNKTLIDLGCNIGFFSFGIARYAKKVTGIDYDKDAIDLNLKNMKENNVENTEFINSKITLELLEKIGPVDCMLGLAMHSWIMHESGREEMEKIIDWSSKNAKVNFIEIQYRGEPGQLEWLQNDEDCKKYLEQWFKYVYRVISINGWGPRTIWKCMNDLGEFKPVYSSPKTKCYLSDNCIFKKVKTNNNFSFDNEIEYLKRLESANNFPKYLFHTNDELVLSGINGMSINHFMGKKQFVPDPKHFKSKLFEIYYVLEKSNIKHQDISVENLVLSYTGELFLVDFEHASDLNGEIKNPRFKNKQDITNVTMIDTTINDMVLGHAYFSK